VKYLCHYTTFIFLSLGIDEIKNNYEHVQRCEGFSLENLKVYLSKCHKETTSGMIVTLNFSFVLMKII